MTLKNAFQNRKTILLYSLVGGAAVSSDQALKFWTEMNIPLNQVRKFGGQNFVLLTSLANSGIVWQNYSQLHPGEVEPYIRYYPTLFLAFFTFLYWRLRLESALLPEKIGLALFFCGGLSNLLSHWRSYFVMDTLQVYLGFGLYQTFNLADLWISLGMGLLIFSMMGEWVRSLSSYQTA